MPRRCLLVFVALLLALSPAHANPTGNCPAARMALWREWSALPASQRNELRGRYEYGDRVIATRGGSIRAHGMDCEDAQSLAEDVLGGG
jgi:hypothetical protein